MNTKRTWVNTSVAETYLTRSPKLLAVLKLIIETPDLSRLEIQEALKITKPLARKYIWRLREIGMIYYSGWTKQGDTPIRWAPLYRFRSNAETDTPIPKR